MEDGSLLRDYAETGSEAAFAALMKRHLGLVYSAALRRLGNRQAAEEVTQTVFCLLARKARTLRSEVALASWLYRSVNLEAAKCWRTEYRRRRREEQAVQMNIDNPTADATWEQMAPHVDEAMTQLGEADRVALLLRFFQNRSFQQVGQALVISEDAARMRVNRALEKLRSLLSGKAAVYSSATLSALLVENASQAVPAASSSVIEAAALRAVRVAVVPSGAAGLLSYLTKSPMGVAVVAGIVVLAVLTVSFHVNHPGAEPERVANAVSESKADRSRNQNLRDGSKVRLVNVSAESKAVDPRVATAKAFYEQGNAHRSQQKYDDALVDYSRAIELIEQGLPQERWFSDAYFARACLYDGHATEAKRDYAKAIADYSKELELEPKLYSPLFNRALDYTHLRRYEEAIAGFTQIITDPETDFTWNGDGKTNCLAAAYEYRGKAWEANKDYAKAIADFTESLRLNPSGSDGVVYFHRGWCYHKVGQMDRVQDEADQMSEMALKLATAPGANDSAVSKALSIARWASEIVDQKKPYQLEVMRPSMRRRASSQKLFVNKPGPLN